MKSNFVDLSESFVFLIYLKCNVFNYIHRVLRINALVSFRVKLLVLMCKFICSLRYVQFVNVLHKCTWTSSLSL